MSAKGLRSRQVRARASVFIAIIASATMRVVAAASLLPRITAGTPVGIEGIVCVTMVTETLMYRDRSAQPTTSLRLVG